MFFPTISNYFHLGAAFDYLLSKQTELDSPSFLQVFVNGIRFLIFHHAIIKFVSLSRLLSQFPSHDLLIC